jgi:hypothetical protein
MTIRRFYLGLCLLGLLSALAFTGFVLIEGKRIGLARHWLPIAASCLVGVSLGLPLFLYQRQVHLERTAA